MQKWKLILAILSSIALAQEPNCPPSSFYVDEYGACIHPDNDASPMGFAEMYCQAFGGHLVSIRDSFNNSMITGIQLTSLTQKRGFLGLRRSSDGTFVWTDGTPSNYNNWAPGEPSRGDCVSLDSNDKSWRTVDCDATLPYLCAWPEITPPDCTSSTPAPFSCPRGSTFIDEIQSCLHADNNLVPFLLAEKYCQAYNGHLFSIHDLDTDSFLTGVSYTEISRGYFYIGARKINSQWNWTDQTPWDYSNWNNGEPQLNCGSIEKRTAKWTSVDCTTPLPFMCNIPPIINGGCTTPFPPSTTANQPSAVPTMTPLTCQSPPSQPLYTCYNGWQYFPTTDSSYLVGFNASFSNAEAYCQSQGAHLASVHSAVEDMFISSLCCATDCRDRSFGDYAGGFIIGGTKENGNWAWTDGSPFDYRHTLCQDAMDGEFLWVLTDTCADCSGPGDWIFADTDNAYGIPYFACKRPGIVTGAEVRDFSDLEGSRFESAVLPGRRAFNSPLPRKKTNNKIGKQ